MNHPITKHVYFAREHENTPNKKYVFSGEIAIGLNNEVLLSSPLGSCVAVVAFEEEKRIGGMAHVMLPGSAPDTQIRNKKLYAFNAINFLIKSLKQKGARLKNIKACIVGGANVLKKENDFISKELTDSIINILGEKQIPITASAVGGFERRVAIFNLYTKEVFYTEGDADKTFLHKFD